MTGKEEHYALRLNVSLIYCYKRSLKGISPNL